MTGAVIGWGRWGRAFWSILHKDMRTYYLKPPNISWGLLFPLAWTGMFFIRSGGVDDIRSLLPGLATISILFGFPMIFLCGLFFPIGDLPLLLQPLVWLLP